MNCDYCGKSMALRRGTYRIKTIEIGEVFVPDVIFHECVNCDESYLVKAQAGRVMRFVESMIAAAIAKLPIGDFVSMHAAAESLGVTKQAFAKNKRIKRGFIYNFNIDGRSYYYRPSVEAFKATGDGRIPLKQTGGDILKISAHRPIIAVQNWTGVRSVTKLIGSETSNYLFEQCKSHFATPILGGTVAYTPIYPGVGKETVRTSINKSVNLAKGFSEWPH